MLKTEPAIFEGSVIFIDEDGGNPGVRLKKPSGEWLVVQNEYEI